MQSTEDLMSLWMETYESTVGRFWESATVGPAREKTERVMKGYSGTADLFAAWGTSNVNLHNVFLEAMRRTYEKNLADSEGGLSADPHKDLYKTWMEVYSDTFKDFMSTGHFAADQGELLSKSMEFQQFNRELLEENLLRPMNLPTKSEMDELGKELYHVKHATKLLKRQLSDVPSTQELAAIRAEVATVRSENEALKAELVATGKASAKALETAEKKSEAAFKEHERMNAELKAMKREMTELGKALKAAAPKKAAATKSTPKSTPKSSGA